MFSMLPTHPQTYGQSNHHTPHKPSPLSSSPLRRHSTPSPLSPRDINVQTRAQVEDAIMSSPSKISSPSQFSANTNTLFTTTPESARKSYTQTQNMNRSLISPPPTKIESAYSKRTTKPNPLMSGGRSSSDEGRETRRELFLKRVREGSEEKKWRRRGENEEFLRVLWLSEERRRGEGRRREALVIEELPEEEQAGWMGIEELLDNEEPLTEELELDAILSGMDPEATRFNYGSAPSASFGGMDTSEHVSYSKPIDQQSIWGSDDDEYDEVFMDVIQQESRTSNQQQPTGYVQDEDMMDMS
ncbi:uncharacterized protein RAG0_07324 [Rhynchosporium agropyri]|uniref:Uncharacterized protein n=1 Tax=Rhynchosporium agropyri TaxID=914238 RepID=A0A1E1KKZ5_9HELO|nr:uncharacterized protein RAG0_07324 [Rhynchosporium agropyri]